MNKREEFHPVALWLIVVLVGLLLLTMAGVAVRGVFRSNEAALCERNYGDAVPVGFMEIECIPMGIISEDGRLLLIPEIIDRASEGCPVVSGKIPDCSAKE